MRPAPPRVTSTRAPRASAAARMRANVVASGKRSKDASFASEVTSREKSARCVTRESVAFQSVPARRYSGR